MAEREAGQREGRDLVNEVTLRIHPLVLGTGLRPFDRDNGGEELPRVKLANSSTTPKGVVVATNRPG